MLMPFCDDHAEKCTKYHKVEVWADIKQIWAIAAAAVVTWDPKALRNWTTRTKDPFWGKQRPDSAQNWVTLLTIAPRTKATGSNGDLSPLEFTGGQWKIAHIRFLGLDWMTCLANYGGSSSHLAISNNLDNVQQRCFWLQTWNNVGKWCHQYNICAANQGPRTSSWGLLLLYNVKILQHLWVREMGTTPFAPIFRWHGWVLYQSSEGSPVKSCHNTPERLRC
jgi:hypothetical protein